MWSAGLQRVLEPPPHNRPQASARPPTDHRQSAARPLDSGPPRPNDAETKSCHRQPATRPSGAGLASSVRESAVVEGPSRAPAKRGISAPQNDALVRDSAEEHFLFGPRYSGPPGESRPGRRGRCGGTKPDTGQRQVGTTADWLFSVGLGVMAMRRNDETRQLELPAAAGSRRTASETSLTRLRGRRYASVPRASVLGCEAPWVSKQLRTGWEPSSTAVALRCRRESCPETVRPTAGLSS